MSSAARNRLRRLRILQALNMAYPDELPEAQLLRIALEDPELSPTPRLVRRSLSYLEDLDLVDIRKLVDPRPGAEKRDIWIARCRPAGVDYLEGPDPGVPGIRHPDEFLYHHAPGGDAE